MSFQIKVGATDVGGITVTGGRVVLQEWPGILAKQIEVALPDLAAASWPQIGSIAVPRQFSVGIQLIGSNAAAFNTLWNAVSAVVETTGTVTLTRVRDLTAGTETATAEAVYLGGLDPTMASHSIGRCVPRWQLLEEWA